MTSSAEVQIFWIFLWVGLGRVGSSCIMFIFKVVIILQYKKCILLLYSLNVAALILTFLCDLTNIRDQLLFVKSPRSQNSRNKVHAKNTGFTVCGFGWVFGYEHGPMDNSRLHSLSHGLPLSEISRTFIRKFLSNHI